RDPITFFQSVLLQWINPKAWAGALSIVTIYTVPEHYATSLLLAAGVTILIIFSAVSLWSLSGKAMKRLLHDPRKIRIFNSIMALLLILSVGMMLFESG
ncbi:LysE family translocator, partial [Nitratifractor sp.]